MAKIGLIDVDGHNYPNLPLMKLSAYHKAQGDEVEWYQPLWGGYCDIVYMSKVFSFTPDYPYPINAGEVIKGGSGYAISLEDGKEVYHKEMDVDLADEIEHIYPDYSLYPKMTENHSFGFLTKGCPRGCDFCHVASKEGRCSYKVADLDEFWKGQKEIELLDPNILACRDHKDLLQQLIDSKARVEFNQGMDVRLITDSNLKLLKQIKLKSVHFAFDRWQDKDIVEPKLQMVSKETDWSRSKVSVYILTNFDTTIEQDLYRIELCRRLNFQPYVMIYDKAHCDPIYRKLQRYCNPYIFWSIKSFKEYTG